VGLFFRHGVVKTIGLNASYISYLTFAPVTIVDYMHDGCFTFKSFYCVFYRTVAPCTPNLQDSLAAAAGNTRIHKNSRPQICGLPSNPRSCTGCPSL